jgi:4-cresol dehydrogenase (hydroxylating) flavoprotein subunit
MDSEKLSLAIGEWRARIGAQAMLKGALAQERYGIGTTGVERAIPAALRPRNVEDIVAIVDIARRHGIPLYPISTGHNWGYGSSLPVTDGCVVLDLSGLDRIVDMDAELGLVTVEPGVTQQGLHDYLDCNGLPFLVPVTGAGPGCSLVGNALERGYGITPYADHFAAVTALEAVLPNGRIYRSALSELGGNAVARAFKWGIGPYLDGLFAQGNFAVVTRMTIALAPRPERIEAFFFGVEQDAGLEPAVAAIQRVLRSLGGVTGSINLMNTRRMLAMMEPYPQTDIGHGILPAEFTAKLAKKYRVTAWTGLGALYGKTEIVKAARRAVRTILGPAASRLVFLSPGRAARLSYLLHHIPMLHRGRLARRARALDAAMQLIAGKPSRVALPLAYWRSATPPHPGTELDPARDGCGLIWYSPLVPMVPSRVRRYVDVVGDICAGHRIEPLITLTSLSDRCFDSSVPLLFDRRDANQTANAQSCYQALLEAGRREGFLPYRLGIGSMSWLTDSDAPCWEMVAAIKSVLDPEGIIAPGRYVPLPRPCPSPTRGK